MINEVRNALQAAGFTAIAANDATVARLAEGMDQCESGSIRVVTSKDFDGWQSVKVVGTKRHD